MHALLLTALLIAAPPNAPAFHPVLLPLHNSDVPGASGSRWKVDEMIFNGSDASIPFYPYYPVLHPLFGPAEVREMAPGERVAAGSLDQPQPCRGCRPSPDPGAILWIPREARPGLVLYDRVFEAGHDGDNRGAIVPAVGEEQFRTGRITFVDVPAEEGFRTTVRVYNLAERPLTLAVRVEDAAGKVAARTVVTLAKVHGTYPDNDVPFLPGYAQISVESLLAPGTSGPVHIVLEPESPEALFWAFASITSNSAQRVTVMTP
jgi:hypothetical protein